MMVMVVGNSVDDVQVADDCVTILMTGRDFGSSQTTKSPSQGVLESGTTRKRLPVQKK